MSIIFKWPAHPASQGILILSFDFSSSELTTNMRPDKIIIILFNLIIATVFFEQIISVCMYIYIYSFTIIFALLLFNIKAMHHRTAIFRIRRGMMIQTLFP